MKKMKKMFIVSALVLIGLLVLSGCGTGAKTGSTTAPPAPSGGNSEGEGNADGGGNAEAGGEDKASNAGFREYRIGEETEVGPLSVAAIYFQPVDMEPVQYAGIKPADADMHLEADITALDNNELGFGAGSFVPYLKVKYQITNKETGKEVTGTFMPMNAKDGTHYGANVKLGGAGNYIVKYSIESLEKSSFLIHTDQVTGVPGKYWTKPLEVSFDFPWVPRKW